MKKDEKPKAAETEETISYPRLDLERALPILKKIEESGGVVLRNELAQICGVNERGGGFNHIIAALKLYGIINKEGQSDFRISDLGREIVKKDKNSILQALVKVPIFNDLIRRYHRNIPKKVIVKGYISSKYGVEKNTANTIASRFIKNVRFLNSLSGDVSLPKDLPSGEPKTDFAAYKTLVDVSAALKLEEIEGFEEAFEKIKGINLPLISGKEIIENLSNIQTENEEEKKKILQIILELMIQSYNK